MLRDIKTTEHSCKEIERKQSPCDRREGWKDRRTQTIDAKAWKRQNKTEISKTWTVIIPSNFHQTVFLWPLSSRLPNLNPISKKHRCRHSFGAKNLKHRSTILQKINLDQVGPAWYKLSKYCRLYQATSGCLVWRSGVRITSTRLWGHPLPLPFFPWPSERSVFLITNRYSSVSTHKRAGTATNISHAKTWTCERKQPSKRTKLEPRWHKLIADNCGILHANGFVSSFVSLLVVTSTRIRKTLTGND